METRARRRARSAAAEPAPAAEGAEGAEGEYDMDAPYNLQTTNLAVAFVVILFLIALFGFTAGYMNRITGPPAP